MMLGSKDVYKRQVEDSGVFLCAEHFHKCHIFIKDKEICRKPKVSVVFPCPVILHEDVYKRQRSGIKGVEQVFKDRMELYHAHTPVQIADKALSVLDRKSVV